MALWAAALMMLVLPVASVFLSHRIAGPAYRLRKAARDVAAGNYAFRIHLRTHDYLKPTAEAFNAMLTQLETQAAADAQRNAAVRDAILLALKKLESPDDLALPAALRLLEEAAAKLP
jgi:nitrogen fixation/metabolism regulation signal transduction histidine kinase